MSEERTAEKGTWNHQLSERAAKLTEKGAHYFVGWLIGAGTQNPEVQTEFERALHKLETDPSLKYCWKDEPSSQSEAGVN